MTWLFIRFYAGILIVLLLAWLIYDSVLENRSKADLARVVVKAHRGGTRLIIERIKQVAPEKLPEELEALGESFRTPLAKTTLSELPPSAQAQIKSGDDCVYVSSDMGHYVVASDAGAEPYLRMGPFPNYSVAEIEGSVVGWARIAKEQLESRNSDLPPGELPSVESLADLRKQFEIGVDVVSTDTIPAPVQDRLSRGHEVVFYEADPRGSEQRYAAMILHGGEASLRFGPFPNFEKIDQEAATTTLGLVLIPAALAIAFLLRPVARQLRQVENAAKSFAAGDMNVRVDQDGLRAAKPLAQSFNAMAEQTQTLLKSQRELLQAVSHELRTPLARIRFAADLVESATTDQQRTERLKAVDDATQQLDDLVSELLNYVRRESDGLQSDVEPVSVHETLCETRDTIAPLHPSIQITVLDVDEEIVSDTDRAQLVRAISNIVRNAARHAQSKVQMSTTKTKDNVQILVDDDGAGIAETDRKKVFQPFVRLGDGSDSGTGLGLALVLRIITAHGGSVEIQTSPLGGARFVITLPNVS